MQNWIEFITTVFVSMPACVCLLGSDSAVVSLLCLVALNPPSAHLRIVTRNIF